MRHDRAIHSLGAGVLLLCCACAGGLRARACAIDQRPSVYANGHLARINTVAPETQAQMATWSYFVFPSAFPVRRPITLTENRREVARTLMPAAMRQPWGWLFGDGQRAQGWTVHHTYARPGTWRIRVFAYNPESRHWDLFDQVTITIER